MINTDETYFKPTETDEDKKDYRSIFRARVFQLLAWGYEKLEANSFGKKQEPVITGRLVEEIEKILNDRSSPFWVQYFCLHEDPRIHVPDREGKERKMVDLDFEFVRHGKRPHFSFEAKRLSANSHPICVYLGPAGLGEFLSGEYGRNDPEGGMLGYVQSHTPEHWVKQAKSNFSKPPGKYKTCLDGIWKQTKIVHDLPYCYQTKHDRSVGKTPITIIHCFLDFTA